MPDLADQVEWLTYAEMAERLGITVGSARTLTKRHRWARRTGNDSLARIAVPVDRITTAGEPPNRGITVPPNELGNVPGIEPPNEGGNEPPLAVAVQLARAEGEIAGLRDALTRSETTAAIYRADLEAERERTWGLVADLRRIAERMAEADAMRARPVSWWKRIAG